MSLGEHQNLPVASPQATGKLKSHHCLTLLILFVPYEMSGIVSVRNGRDISC